MKKRTIYITEFDMERLKKRLFESETIPERDKENLAELEQELMRAEIVSPKEIPQDVITMNSTVRLKYLDTEKEMIYTVVFPSDADVAQNKISVLAPIGTALIGYGVGDIITWKVPAGLRKLRVEEIIYQPEAAGHYDL
ncbi:MAG: nucleoside diphosphate kinase regulator [Nitrospirota bacterium]